MVVPRRGRVRKLREWRRVGKAGGGGDAVIHRGRRRAVVGKDGDKGVGRGNE